MLYGWEGNRRSEVALPCVIERVMADDLDMNTPPVNRLPCHYCVT